MQEITILTPYLLTKFYIFSVYLISGTWNAIWNFSRDLKGKSIKTRVITSVYWPGGPHKTKTRPSQPRRVAGQPHFCAKHLETWWLRSPRGGNEEIDFFAKAVCPQGMPSRPRVGHPTVHLHGNASAKLVEPTLGPYKYLPPPSPSCQFVIHTNILHSRFPLEKASVL
jgi:hypothetical protein